MSAAPIPWKHIRNVLVLFAPLWVGAVFVFGLFGLTYSLLQREYYSARQALVVRDEANSSPDRLGRFVNQTELKAAQETILEMTRNREVVAAALRQIGPPEGKDAGKWPSIANIDSAIGRVNLTAPHGAEFGNTEVVYLQVKDESPERATELCRAVFENLTIHLRNVRRVRADSVIVELSHARDLAEQNLAEVSKRMQEIEVQFGSDLAELRSLTDSFSGDGTNRRALQQTTEQLRLAELNLEKSESLFSLLKAGAEDPQQLLINGGDLLTSQPALQRLKEGLIDAQLRTSQLVGIYTLENPKRKAAIATEEEIRRRITQETLSVLESMKPALALQRTQVAKLQKKKGELSTRLEQLAEARTRYTKIDSELKQRTEQLALAEQRLADAKASRSAALSTNLVAELAPPQVNDDPIGPGKGTMTLGSMVAGLILGLGAVFLVAPGPTHSQGRRRWTDHIQGRNRRASDQPAQPTAGEEAEATPTQSR